MGNIHASQEEALPVQPPRPKKLLWGCGTTEEHYNYIEDACARVADKKGEEGLKLLGFEYRLVHHPATCMCGDAYLSDSDDWNNPSPPDESKETYEMLNDLKVEEQDRNVLIGDCYMVPVGTPIASNKEKSRPVVERTMTTLIEETIMGFTDESPQSRPTSRPISRSSSTVSMFSLATHHTMGSSVSGTPCPETQGCSLRLHHVPSGWTMLTPENHQAFIANGKMYDEVARLCMECGQDYMMEEGDLEWVTVCDARGISALKSREAHEGRKILLIVTGKGKVRAGIFSRRHLMTTGMEASTALPLVREAVKRNMSIVMLDPNARGDRKGMDVIEASLEHLFADVNEEVYVLAHSMAGAQLVRYLHNKSAESSAKEGSHEEQNEAEVSLMSNIKAVAFTDSNHNINWTKSNPSLTDLLVGPSCLYIKSHKAHEEPKPLGEPHHDCQFWRHRFGDIRTLWAGTSEHALTNHTARHHIWNHFDSFIEQDKRGNSNNQDS